MAYHLALAKNMNTIKNAERAKIIYSTHMIVMFVRDQDSVNRPVSLREHLLAEIRAAIDEDTRDTALRIGHNGILIQLIPPAKLLFDKGRWGTLAPIQFYHNAGAQTAVVRVGRRTDLAATTNHRYAITGAGTEESDLHLQND